MAVPVIASSDHVAGSSGSTVVIPAPSGIANGDILMAQVGVETDSVTVSPPSGFASLIKMIRSGIGAIEIFWKRAASESGSYTFTVTGAGWSYGSMSRITGAVASGSPIDVLGAGTNGTDTTAELTTVTTTTADVLVLAFSGDMNGDTGVATSPLTEVYDSPAASNADYLASMPKTSAGATGGQLITWSSNPNNWVGVLIGIASTAAGGAFLAEKNKLSGQAVKRASEW